MSLFTLRREKKGKKLKNQEKIKKKEKMTTLINVDYACINCGKLFIPKRKYKKLVKRCVRCYKQFIRRTCLYNACSFVSVPDSCFCYKHDHLSGGDSEVFWKNMREEQERRRRAYEQKRKEEENR